MTLPSPVRPSPVRAGRGSLAEAVSARLKAEIADGRFAQADVLPGERELCEMLDVSRTTLRRAIDSLVGEGALSRHHGAGTFVRRGAPHIDQPLSRLTSFTEDMRLRGLTASSAEIRRGLFLPTPEETMMLGVSPRDKVFRFDRLRLADGVPMAVERAVVPEAFIGDGADVGESLYSALGARGWRPVRALQRLRAVILAPDEARLLEAPKRAAALEIHRIAYLSDGRCVEYTHSFYRSDVYDFVAELSLGDGRGAPA